MILPDRYSKTMREFLGGDYPAWQDSFLALPERGIRVNELKIGAEDFRKMWSLKEPDAGLEPVPWIHNGFYISDTVYFSSHPFYQAGLYYIQEPSAMTPAEILPIEKGDCVLDLCAAPGGKATELLARLKGTGLLYANDISVSRAQALRKNIEMAGASNAYITAEDPEKLAEAFPLFFDKILVDAPCSGEGMFRRRPEMISEWENRGPLYYAALQENILSRAVRMLSPGGMLLYSTCTFSEIENEGNVRKLLENNPDLKLCEIRNHTGFLKSRDPRLQECIRVMPHRMRGEGQFVCLMQKVRQRGESRTAVPVNSNRSVYEREGKVYLLPCGHLPRPGLRYLMTGLHAGTVHAGRLNPTQALAQALRAGGWPRTLNLDIHDIRLMKYLKGESISYDDSEISAGNDTEPGISGIRFADISCRSDRTVRSASRIKRSGDNVPAGRAVSDRQLCALCTEDVLVLADGFPVGFGRAGRGLLKNKRNPGWRIQ